MLDGGHVSVIGQPKSCKIASNGSDELLVQLDQLVQLDHNASGANRGTDMRAPLVE
jgi:hypothetical protein